MSKIYTAWHVILKHKTLLTILFFVALVGFVDENSVWQRRHRSARMDEMRATIASLRKAYERDSLALHKLETDPEEAIRVAREDYYMARENEDVFVVTSDTLRR